PYAWDKYDQLIVRDFAWGGMENTSATTLYLPAARGGAGSQSDLISHELAHQWFGDLVTCRAWEHLWLNEGWASIAEALWREQEATLKAAGVEAPTDEAHDSPAAEGGEGDAGAPPADQPDAPKAKPARKPKPTRRGLGSAAADIAPQSEEGRRA